MKHRDNKMYYLSDDSNLESHDKTVLAKHKPYALFDHKILMSETDKIQHAKGSLTNLWGKQLKGEKLNYAAIE